MHCFAFLLQSRSAEATESEVDDARSSVTKPSSSATAKAKAKAKPKKGAKGTKHCKGCGQWLLVDQFAPSKGLCQRDQKAWRNLQTLAKAQDSESWLEDQHADPKKFRSLLEAYHQACGNDGSKRNKRGKFCVMTYKEKQRQIAGLYFDSEMQLMHLDQYVVWASDPVNGGHNPSKSTAEWQAAAKAPNAITDLKGPADSRLRVAMPIRDLVKKRDGFEKSKEVEASESKKEGYCVGY